MSHGETICLRGLRQDKLNPTSAQLHRLAGILKLCMEIAWLVYFSNSE